MWRVFHSHRPHRGTSHRHFSRLPYRAVHSSHTPSYAAVKARHTILRTTFESPTLIGRRTRRRSDVPSEPSQETSTLGRPPFVCCVVSFAQPGNGPETARWLSESREIARAGDPARSERNQMEPGILPRGFAPICRVYAGSLPNMLLLRMR